METPDNWVLTNLCYYDPRNPDFDKENGDKSNDCFCDNCFYGRNKLAEEILKLISEKQQN